MESGKWQDWRGGECKVYVYITAQIENQCVIFSLQNTFDTISTKSCRWPVVEFHGKAFSLSGKVLGMSSEPKSMQHLIGLKCQAAAGTNAHNFNQNNCPLAVKLLRAALPHASSPAVLLALRVAYIVKFQFAYHKKMSIPQQIRLSAACNDKNAETTTLSWHGLSYVARIKS